MRERWASLISGGGTTMQEMALACKSGKIPIDIACIISSDPLAKGIEKARKSGIPERDIVVVNPNNFRGEDGELDEYAYGQALLKETKPRGVTVITQNGHLPHTPGVVIDEYPDVMFNQHPGLLPETKGMHGNQVHATVLYLRRVTKRDMWTEAIAQRVHKEFDKGAIVKSARVDIFPDDTVDDLQKRVLPIEHQLQIKLLQDFVKGDIKEQPSKEIFLQLGEESVLFEARRVGRLLYPKG